MIDKIIGKGIIALVQEAVNNEMFARNDASYEPNVIVNRRLEPYVETVVEIASLHPKMQSILRDYQVGEFSTEDFFLDVAASCLEIEE